MSKGKDFRAPRKRGFDDDGPMPYEPKPRSSRAFGGAPDAGFGGPSLGGGAPPAAVSGPTVDAVVKWFKADKGYGFVELANGQGDAFLHANTLNAAGHAAVSPGASLRVRIGQGQKGRQVSEVISVDESTATPRGAPTRAPGAPPGGGMGMGAGGAAPRRGPPSGPSVEMQGTVKWYNATKGFGFVAPLEGGKDVFVHASALQRAGVTQLAEGQTISMDVVQGAKGPEATAIRVN